MFRSPYVLSLLLIAGSALTPLAHAQQPARSFPGATPAVDPAAVLATLKDLRSRQPAVVGREKASVLAAIGAAMADPGKAYEQAYAAVELQGGSGNESPRTGGGEGSRSVGGSGNEGSRIVEWRKREGDLLRNREFINGLHLQLVYLALTWQHQMGVKSADLVGPLLEYTSQVTAAAESLAPFEPLRKSVTETVFAPYFQMTPFLTGLTGWEEHPLNVDGIYQKTILPEFRLEKDARLLTYWDNRIQAESVRAEASQNSLVINKFKSIQLPALLWDRTQDEIALGRQNQAILDMVAIVKAHPDHPDFQKWASKLEEIVTPPAPSPAPSPSAATLPAATPIVPPAAQ